MTVVGGAGDAERRIGGMAHVLLMAEMVHRLRIVL
jgi:hypothetical protein